MAISIAETCSWWYFLQCKLCWRSIRWFYKIKYSIIFQCNKLEQRRSTQGIISSVASSWATNHDCAALCFLQTFLFLCGEVPRSRSYGRTAALRLLVQPCDEDERKMISFSFFHVMEHRWNETDMGNPKYSWKNLSHCHFVHHKSYTDWFGMEPEHPRWKAGD
jgi:hypothetical protein